MPARRPLSGGLQLALGTAFILAALLFASTAHAHSATDVVDDVERIGQICSLLQIDRRKLDTPGQRQCRSLLAESDLDAFALRWGSVSAAADEVLKVLVQQLRAARKGPRRRALLEDLDDALNHFNSTVNILSENEPVGVTYEGNGLLDGIDLFVHPSLLSGIFQTAQPTPAAGLRMSPTVTGSTLVTPTATRLTWAEYTSAVGAASAASAYKAAAQATMAPEYGIAIQGQGLLDGVDVTIKPEILRGLTNLPSFLASLLLPIQTHAAPPAAETGVCG